MPVFMAIIVASLCAFLVKELLDNISSILGVIAAFFVWVIAFYFVKRFIIKIRPK